MSLDRERLHRSDIFHYPTDARLTSTVATVKTDGHSSQTLIITR